MTTSAEIAIRNPAPGGMGHASKKRIPPLVSASEAAVRLTLNITRVTSSTVWIVDSIC